MKVYRFNEMEYIAGPNWPKAIRWYFKETGVSVEEGLDEDAYELTAEDMDCMKFCDVEGEFGPGEASGTLTFREALEKVLESRRQAKPAAIPGVRPSEADPLEPFFFAGTEY